MTTESLRIRFYAPDRTESDDVEALLRYAAETFELTGADDSTTRALGPDDVEAFPEDTPIEAAVEQVSAGRHGALWFRAIDVEFGLHVHPDSDDVATYTVSVPEHFVKISRTEAVRTVVEDVVLALYDHLGPHFAYGDTYLEDEQLDRERLDAGRVDRAFWLLAFGPDLVQTLGAECLDGLSAARFDVLDDGGRLVLLSDNPKTFRETQRAEAEHVLREECGP